MTTRRNLTSVPHTSTSQAEAPIAAEPTSQSVNNLAASTPDLTAHPSAPSVRATDPTAIANAVQSLADGEGAGTVQMAGEVEGDRPPVRGEQVQNRRANGVLTTHDIGSAAVTKAGTAAGPNPTAEAPRTYPMGATALRKRPEVAPTHGALALQYEVDEEVPPRPTLRLVPNAPALPEVREWATRLVQAIAETIGGDRPVSQLTRWTDTAVYVDVHRRVRLLGLTTTAGKRATKERSSVRSVHICRPEAGVAEVAAHLRTSGRSRAMALRLEIRRGRWVCTALELG